MSEARRKIVSRLRAYKNACRDENLVSRSIVDPDRDPARLLRNGLAVSGFAMLEQFVRARFAEILKHISDAEIPFSQLPDALRLHTTVEAASTISKQLRRRQDLGKIEYSQRHAEMIASTQYSGYELSPLAFGHKSSNLSAGRIEHLMSIVGVKNGWDNMNRVGSRVNASVPSMRTAYESAAKQRHKGAHQASAETDAKDLESFWLHATAIAISFDALISEAARLYKARDEEFIFGDRSVKSSDIVIRFVDPRDDTWREQAEGADRAARVEYDRDKLVSKSRTRADRRNEFLVVRTESRFPIQWYVGGLE